MSAQIRRLRAPYISDPKLWHSRRGFPMVMAISLFIGFLITIASIQLAAAAVSSAAPVSVVESLGSIGMPPFTGVAITACFSAAASYLLISRVWIWHFAAKRRRLRP